MHFNGREVILIKLRTRVTKLLAQSEVAGAESTRVPTLKSLYPNRSILNNYFSCVKTETYDGRGGGEEEEEFERYCSVRTMVLGQHTKRNAIARRKLPIK